MTTLHFPPLVSIMVKNYLLVSLFNRVGHGAIRHEITPLPARLATQLVQEAASGPGWRCGQPPSFQTQAIKLSSLGASANQHSVFALQSSVVTFPFAIFFFFPVL